MTKVVFFGTPDYVLPILDALAKHHKIVAVVTQPPKIVGRERLKQFSPVDTWAHKKRIPIYFESAKIIEEKIDTDLGILAAYGEFIPKNVISYFKYGILNVHPSLLPTYRGASPVQAAIVANEKVTGVSIIKLDEEMDHGPVVSKFSEDVLPEDTADSLRKRLFARSAQFLIDLIPNYLNRKIKPEEQDHSKATFTKILRKEDGFIPPEYLAAALQGRSFKGRWPFRFMNGYEIEITPASIERFIRSMKPWPISWTNVQLTKDLKLDTHDKKRLKILKAHVEKKEVLGVQFSVLCLDSVQLEGKKPVSWQQFKQGYPEAKFT